MTVTIRNAHNCSDGDLEALSALLESVGMRTRDTVKMRRAMVNSSYCVLVCDNETLIGFGRLVSDGVYYGSLWDIAVKPEYQSQGVGTMIVRELIAKAKE